MNRKLPMLLLLAAAPLCSMPRPAAAGAAGGAFLGCNAAQQIRFVVDANGNGVREASENTTCTNLFVDEATNPDEPIFHNTSANGPVCLPATQAQLSGTATLIADDNARDNDAVNTGTTLTLLLELGNQSQIFRLADSFTSNALGNLVIGNWDNRVQEEFNIFGTKFKGALFLTPSGVNPGALQDMGNKLAQLADDLNIIPGAASTVIPIVASGTRDAARKRFVQVSATGCGDSSVFPAVPAGCGELEDDESGATKPLASIAVYKITISFAQKVTGSPPTCQ